LRQSDRAANAARKHRSYTTQRGTIGSLAAGKVGGHRKSVLEAHPAFIQERIDQTPHLTQRQLKDELAAQGVVVSHNAVWTFLRREGLRFRKP